MFTVTFTSIILRQKKVANYHMNRKPVMHMCVSYYEGGKTKMEHNGPKLQKLFKYHTYVLFFNFFFSFQFFFNTNYLGSTDLASVKKSENVFEDSGAQFLHKPPKPLDQSKNVTVRTFHIWPGSVHEHIFFGTRWHQGAPAPCSTAQR